MRSVYRVSLFVVCLICMIGIQLPSVWAKPSPDEAIKLLMDGNI